MSNNKTAEKGKKFEIKPKKLLRSALTGFTVPFVLIIASSLISYFENAEKFIFSVWDFLWPLLLVSLGVFLVITAALYFTKGIAHRLIYAICVGVLVAATVQRFITTLTFVGLPGDGNVAPTPAGTVIANILLWCAIIITAIVMVMFLKKQKLCKTIFSFLVIIALVMQSAMLVPAIINKKDYTGEGYLTTEGMWELSANDNVVFFLIDRFDDYYYKEYVKKSPEISEKLDGFTYYSDNISKYPRTYPGVCSLITGVNTDFSKSKDAYLDTAYSDSNLLKDLKNNGYDIKLYAPDYYAYKSVPAVAENKFISKEYEVTDHWNLACRMFELGAYYWAPEAFKSQTISQSSFAPYIERIAKGAEDAPEQYTTNDPEFYKSFAESGLTTNDSKANYTFYYLNGCHSPFTMDENCNAVPKNNTAAGSYPQTAGCFKIIYEYIDEMKRLGIYEDSTIIITGDHATLWDGDKKTYTAPKITALLVKEKGSAGTKLKESDAPVSQDNLAASIVKSTGINASYNYGLAYSEVTAENNPVRTHYFQTWTTDPEVNYTYQITGSGRDFKNWQIIEEKPIEGGIYGNK